MLTLGGQPSFTTIVQLAVTDLRQHKWRNRTYRWWVYARFVTVGNSLNMFSEGQAEALDSAKVAAGDFIGLFEIS